MNLSKALREFFALRERSAFTAEQAGRLLRVNRKVEREPALDDTVKALQRLVDQGHLSTAKDQDSGETLYQVTPLGIAAYEAST